MNADALAPCIIRSSANMALTMNAKQIIIFHQVFSSNCILSQSWDMIENTKFVFSPKISMGPVMWHFDFFCYPEQDVQQTVKLSMISAAIMFINSC